MLNSDLGYKIGNINIGNPVVADDSALLSSDPFELQSMMDLSHVHSVRNHYELHPVKSVVTILRREKANIDSLFTWFLGDYPASIRSEFEHVGLLWQEEELCPDVEARISATRRASYAAMGFGLHDNGIVPKAAIDIANLQILSKLLSGIKATVVSSPDMKKLDRYFHNLLKQIQGLSDNTAREAVYILAGEIPIEAKLELQILELFGSITRMEQGHTLHELAMRQLAVKSKCSKSWFIGATKIATKYSIDACSTLLKQKTQLAWKNECKEKVWLANLCELHDVSRTRSTLAWMILKPPSMPHRIPEIWDTCKGCPKQAETARVRAKLLVGRYGLNKNRSKYRPGINSMCSLCQKQEEDVSHFIAECESTREQAQHKIAELLLLFKVAGLPVPHGKKEITSAVLNGHQFIMEQDMDEYCKDETVAIQIKDKDTIIAAHRLSNNIVGRLHRFREDARKKEKDLCIECRQKVSNADMALSCDGCLRWQHIVCNDIASVTEYQLFLESRAILEWKCRSCCKAMQ
jgi:hypothetical protein